MWALEQFLAQAKLLECRGAFARAPSSSAKAKRRAWRLRSAGFAGLTVRLLAALRRAA
jgi:hypothetical protein